MANNQCPLLALLAELRNRIWNIVIASKNRRACIYVTDSGVSYVPDLLRVSRQIRSDALGIWCARSHFALYHLTSNTGLESYCHWLDRLGDCAVQCIRRIEISAQIWRTENVLWLYYIFDVDISVEDAGGVVRDNRSCGTYTKTVRAFEAELRGEILYARATKSGRPLGVRDWQDLLQTVQQLLKRY